MVFNSIEFLIFLVLFFILWPIFRAKKNLRWIFITGASLIFYAWWDWRFVFLLIGSGLIDFYSGLLITNNPKYKKPFLALSLIANLSALSIFKYSFFIVSIIQDLFLLGGIQIDLVNKIPEFTLILPVGISFYTFQSLSYTIDIYRGRLKPTHSLLHFFSYLSMFPQLVAGPIVRAKDFLKQLETFKIPNQTQKWHAIKLVVYGLFQKMVIADNLSFFIDSAFEGKSQFDGTLYWWIVMIAFSFQIYADFSGYSLIARGIAKYMGYHFKMNFNHPYLSKSLKEFWSKWHISLSTWFRDYVYIPLGGSKKGLYVGIITVTITMCLSGLWHGASYTFIVWSLIHACWLLIERFIRRNNWIEINFKFYPIIVFIQVMIGWVYFRAANVRQGNDIIIKLFSFQHSDLQFIAFYLDHIIFLILAILVEYVVYLKIRIKTLSLFYKKHNLDVLFLATCLVLIIFLRGEGSQFIYFQF